MALISEKSKVTMSFTSVFGWNNSVMENKMIKVCKVKFTEYNTFSSWFSIILENQFCHAGVYWFFLSRNISYETTLRLYSSRPNNEQQS